MSTQLKLAADCSGPRSERQAVASPDSSNGIPCSGELLPGRKRHVANLCRRRTFAQLLKWQLCAQV